MRHCSSRLSSFSLRFRSLWLLTCIATLPLQPLSAEEYEPKPADPSFAKFDALKAPSPQGLYLQKNDQLAIIGDSITEQKRYSRIIETYLTVCTPELNIGVRQYGWSGETAAHFLTRLDNDCLRFHPTIATLCYGMNDFKYRPFDEENGNWYRENYTNLVTRLQKAGARVVVGSPGCVGKVASWVKTASGTLEDHNLSLCAFRNIALSIADSNKTRFADHFWTMFTQGAAARQRYGEAYNIAGNDGVHPDWAGHLVMAYDYLHALGLSGEIGVFEIDLKTGSASASSGHSVEAFTNQTLTLTSNRYPFCATGPLDKDNSVRSGTTLVPFFQELNRLQLVVRGTTASQYEVTWGDQSRTYSAEQLAKGINLAADFEINPFSEAFRRVDEAVAAKQAFETNQIKKVFHGAEGKANMEAAVTKTEAERAPLVSAIRDAMVPVKHTIRLTAK